MNAEANKSLLEQCAVVLRIRSKHKPKRFAFAGIEDLLFRHGALFPPPLKPLGASKLRQMRACFGNCQRIATGREIEPDGRRQYSYVEGFAGISGVGLAVHHAWLVTREGQVYDPTWRVPGTSYFGVAFTPNYLRNAVAWNIAKKQEWHSLLDDAYERFPILSGLTPIDYALTPVEGFRLAQRPTQPRKRGSYARR